MTVDPIARAEEVAGYCRAWGLRDVAVAVETPPLPDTWVPGRVTRSPIATVTVGGELAWRGWESAHGPAETFVGPGEPIGDAIAGAEAGFRAQYFEPREPDFSVGKTIRCDQCDRRNVVTATVGEEPYYESCTARICAQCLVQALNAIATETGKTAHRAPVAASEDGEVVVIGDTVDIAKRRTP